MAHFAQLDSNNIVIQVLKVADEKESKGHDYLANELGLGGTWVQTSFNTRAGIHYGQDGTPDGGVAFRKNYAGKGMTYDPTRDAFIPIKPFPSWVLEEESCVWFPPVTYPGDGKFYDWNEETKTWDLWPNQPEPFPTRG